MGREEKYMLFGFVLLFIGVIAVIWGIASGRWILFPPAATLLFMGVLYVRIRQAGRSRSDGTMLPTHPGRPRGRTQGVKISRTQDF